MEILFDVQYAQQYLREEVSARFYNKEQTDQAIMSSVNETGMRIEELKKIIKTDVRAEGWRIGEYKKYAPSIHQIIVQLTRRCVSADGCAVYAYQN